MFSDHDQPPKPPDPGPAKEPAEGKIGPYELLEVIGEGSMGKVYRAWQTEPLRRQVAVKIVKLGMDTDEFVTRFESERQALALMDHPYIARVFDAGATHLGRPYFVMEYVQGVPITRHCDDKKLGLRERLGLFIQVCEGVQHAHQKGIIHRDIKPSNVLVTCENCETWPKIIDFGVAKTLGPKLTEQTLQTSLGQILGTPEFISPEQADLAETKIDTRTDIYLLGELLYTLLTGVPPFDPEEMRAAGLHALLYKIRSIDPPRPSQRIAELAEKAAPLAAARGVSAAKLKQMLAGDLDWVVMRTLEKEQDRRYQTTLALIEDIQRYLDDEPLMAGPPSRRYRLGKFVKRNRIQVIAAALVLAALVLGVSGTTVGLVRSKIAEKHARTEAETARQVSEFMVSLFEVSDPGEARGNSITAREILDQGVRRIEVGLAEQPQTQARLMSTMGRVYRELGLYTAAQPLLEKSLGTFLTLDEEDAPETAAVMDNLGGLLREVGNFAAAKEVLEKTLDLRARNLGEQHPDYAQSLNSLGNLHWATGEYELAESYYNQALAIREKTLGPDDPEVAVTLKNLGGLRVQAGDLLGALPLFFRSLQIRETSLGPDHPDVGSSLAELGRLQAKLGHLVQARHFQERALAIQEKVYGPDHPLVALSLKDFANMLDDAEDYAGSRPLYERALTIQENKLGPNHPDLAGTMNDLASSLINQGNYGEARVLLEKVLSIQEAALGPDHPEIATVLNNLATTDMFLGRDGVFAALTRALAIQEQALGADHLAVGVTTYNLGAAYAALGDFPAALPLYERSLAIREKQLPANHLLVAESLQGVGMMRMYNGDLAGARDPLQRALVILEDTLGTDHADYGSCLGDWALLHYYEGDFEKAIGLFKTAVAIQERTLPNDHPYLLGNYYNLACLSTITGKIDAALAYLETAADRGYQNPAINEDPDLTGLHGNSRYEQIVGKMWGG